MKYFFAFLILFSVSTEATKQTSVLEVVAVGSHGTQRTELIKEKGRWICKTEIMTEFFAPRAPFEEATLAEVMKATAVTGTCDYKVYVHDKRTGKIRSQICSEDPSVKKLLSQLAENCGRVI